MYAIIQTGGKQYKVSTGDEIFVEKLSAEVGSKVSFDVLAMNTGEDTLVYGSPFVNDASVTAEISKNGKGKKITVFTYKPKKGEKRKLGHRQPYSKVVITELKYKDIVESKADETSADKVSTKES